MAAKNPTGTDNTTSSNVEVATHAEISRQIAQLGERRRAVTEALAEHFKAHGYNTSEPPPAPDVLEARSRARVLLNGRAPASPASRQHRRSNRPWKSSCWRSISPSEFLSSEEVRARAVETVAWQEAHRCRVASTLRRRHPRRHPRSRPRCTGARAAQKRTVASAASATRQRRRRHPGSRQSTAGTQPDHLCGDHGWRPSET